MAHDLRDRLIAATLPRRNDYRLLAKWLQVAARTDRPEMRVLRFVPAIPSLALILAAATLPPLMWAQPYGLEAENLTNPLGVDVVAPRLSWRIDDAVQLAYQLRFAASTALLDAGIASLWDSGKVASGRSNNVSYGGPAVVSRQRVFWQVRVWTDIDPSRPSAWSAPAFWEMGLLNESDWSAQWIGFSPGPPVFVRQFSVSGPVQSARLHIAGLGVYEARINGQAVSADVLAPGNTLYSVRAEYATYDVTSLLVPGANSISVEMGNGTYNLVQPAGRYTKIAGSVANTPILRAQLEISYLFGIQTEATNADWRAMLAPTTTATWWGGEDYDARRAVLRWDLPGADLSGWPQASVIPVESTNFQLTWRGAPGVQITESLVPVAITQPQANTYVFDMGVNFAGWYQLQVSGPAGTKVTLKIGEILNSDGTVSQTTTGSPIFDTYTLSGQGIETWHPRFAYHGFRYLQVTGLPTAPANDTITGLVLRAANEPAGAFSSSNVLLNNIHSIINRAIQSNMMSIFTDCPDREKLGWLGDTSVIFGSIVRNYDVAAYARNVVRNMADSQTQVGLIPDFVPAYTIYDGAFGDDPNWGNAIILVPWSLYETYGDIGTLRTYYPNMERYLDYLSSRSSGYLIQYGLGDWETPEQTVVSPSVVSSYGYYRAAQTMSRISAVLGYSDDSARYAALATNIAAAFNAAFLDAMHHTYDGGQQAADALALDMGIVPANQSQAVLDHLVATIRSAGNHAVVGIVSLGPLVRALAAGGRDDVIYDIAAGTTYPSYGYEVVSGMTSLTETWDMNTGSSFNHMMFGAIDEWFTSGLAGIQQAPGSVGYQSLVIKPAMVSGLSEVKGTYKTPNGLVSSQWSRDSRGRLHLEVTIPGNTTAAIWMPTTASPPAGAIFDVTHGEHGRPYRIYNVGPGTYEFHVGPGPGPAPRR